MGVLTRYHLLRPRRKRVVLVDHNEAAQSVPGLEEAEILEIIDHHRLADIQTTNPIYCPQRARGLHQYHRGRNVPGPGPDALARAWRA